MFKKNGLLSKNIPNSSGEMEIISCHWVKETDNDSSVHASSFWFNNEKLINFSATLQQRQNSCRGVTQK